MESLEKFSSHLTQHFTESDFDEINNISKIVRLKKGDILLQEGDVNKIVFLILEGKVDVKKKLSEGHILHLTTLGTGHIIGEISILTGSAKTATCVAQTDVKAIELDIGKIQKNTDLYEKVLRNLAGELSQKFFFLQPLEAIDAEPPNSILILFGWRWKDIINEVPFLAQHGYDAIKLSPPQESAVTPGHAWWEMYQPVTYHLSSRYGTEEDLKSLISLCHSYGIKVYVDLVLNHMARIENEDAIHTGTNGHKFSKYHYGPMNKDGDYFTEDDFHKHEIQLKEEDYSQLERAWHLEHFELEKLPKLNFERKHVANVIRKYIQYLLDLGVDGFRIDAAKHLNIAAAKNIFSGFVTKGGRKPFIYLEYYIGFPEGVDIHQFMDKYFQMGYVTSFNYGDFLSDAIWNRGHNNLSKLVEHSFGSSWVQFPENRTVVVLDNHDTERYLPHRLNYKKNQNNAYVLAYIFMLAWPFGIPKVMTSAKFSGNHDPLPDRDVWINRNNTFAQPDCPWVCQHRWNAIANMVLFRHRTKEARGITHTWFNGDQVAFARTCQKKGQYLASRGFVVINNSASTLKRRFETGLPDGTYFDMIKCYFDVEKMSGPTISVENYGYAEIEVPPYDAVVINLDFIEQT